MWHSSRWPGGGKTVFLFLAAFRGFALVVAAALLFSTGHFKLLSWPGWILVGIATSYTLFKLLCPFSSYKKNCLNYADFSFDLALTSGAEPMAFNKSPQLGGNLFTVFDEASTASLQGWIFRIK